jgi:hypothetical protein
MNRTTLHSDNGPDMEFESVRDAMKYAGEVNAIRRKAHRRKFKFTVTIHAAHGEILKRVITLPVKPAK